MNLEKLVVIGGLGGVQKVAANRSNGLIIENIDTGKKRFVGARKHQFTPLGSVTIYSQNPDDVIKLSDVFEAMLEKKDSLAIIPVNSSKTDLHAYFSQIMPKYDADNVHASDMKKIIKWFNYLQERDVFTQLEAEEKEAAAKAEAEEATEETATKKETTAEEPKK